MDGNLRHEEPLGCGQLPTEIGLLPGTKLC